MGIVYLKMELKRAGKRLGQLYAGVALLLALAGVLILLAGRMFYGEQVVGRVPVGVVIPSEDVLAKKAIQMLGSLDSVKSVCDFEYRNRDACLAALEKGELYAVLEVPEGFVQDIMSGENTPVFVWMAKDRGIEGNIFRELADAGALTLSAGQAGIYAGNELYCLYGLEKFIGQLELDLNNQYMDYSLQRSVYFRRQNVQAIKDVSVLQFYGISAYVWFLFLAAIPVSGYLLPWNKAMVQKLKTAGIGAGWQIASRIAGMGALLFSGTIPIAVIMAVAGHLSWSPMLAVVWPLSCIAAASLTVLLYQIAGTLLGGIMLLFFAMTGQHFLAGGILPLVFLPGSIQKLAPWLPSAVLMDNMKMVVTKTWDLKTLGACGILILASWLAGALTERGRR